MKKNNIYYQITGILFILLSLITNFLLYKNIDSYILIKIIFLSIPDILILISFVFLNKKKISKNFMVAALITICIFCFIFPWFTSFVPNSFLRGIFGDKFSGYFSIGFYLGLSVDNIRNYKNIKYGFISYSIYIVFDIFFRFLRGYYIINILIILFFSMSIWVYLLHKYIKYYIKPKKKIKSLELKLIKYKDQYEKGEISEEEYVMQKQEILAKCKTISF